MSIYDDVNPAAREVHAPALQSVEHAGTAAPPLLVAGRAASAEAVLHLQQSAGNAAVAQLLADDHGDDAAPADAGRSPVLDVVGGGGGHALDPPTRATMEAGLGADFGDVRIHTDAAAAQSARAVQAHAYTVGSDVVFQSGMYQPDTSNGQRMLAHELTHVIQQRSGPVDGSPAGGGIAVSHPSDRFEQAAEANADRFVSAGHRSEAGPAAAAPSPAIKRSTGVMDDAASQGVFAQRAGPGDDEDKDAEAPVQGAFAQRAEAEDATAEEPAAG